MGQVAEAAQQDRQAGWRRREWGLIRRRRLITLRWRHCSSLTGDGLARIAQPRAQVQPVAHLVQPKGIGRRLAIAQRLGGVVGLKGLVEDPGGDENAKDGVNGLWNSLVIETSTAKTTTWTKPLTNWPLYMAPTPGISPSTAADEGLGPLCRRRNEGLLIALPGRQARLAEKLTSGRVAHATGAERLAAALAIGRRVDTTVIYAIHTVLLSHVSLGEPPECADRC